MDLQLSWLDLYVKDLLTYGNFDASCNFMILQPIYLEL